MGLREKNKAAKRSRIIEAGRRLFADRGFEATSTRALAAEAGIGVGTLFEYFPEKKDLLLELFEDDVRGVVRAIWAGLPGDVGLVDQVVCVARGMFDYYERDVRLSRVFLEELLFLEGERKARLDALSFGFTERLVGLVLAARARGEVGDGVDSLDAAMTLFALYYVALILVLQRDVPRDRVEAGLRTSLGIAVRGMH